MSRISFLKLDSLDHACFTCFRLCASVTDAHAVDPLSEHTDDEEVDEEPDNTHTTSEGEDDYPHAVSLIQ